jgi:hypothetical protein
MKTQTQTPSPTVVIVQNRTAYVIPWNPTCDHERGVYERPDFDRLTLGLDGRTAVCRGCGSVGLPDDHWSPGH